MRAMGPGSVSSLLKTALDVVYYLLLGVAVVSLVLAAVVLIISYDSGLEVTLADGAQVKLTRQLLAEGFAIFAVYSGLVVILLGRVRRVFATLTVGDPFHPANINRLRAIGLGLAALELVNMGVRALIGMQIPGAVHGGWFEFDLTAWFSVLVVFVLAEVFREGARLRREAELTI